MYVVQSLIFLGYRKDLHLFFFFFFLNNPPTPKISPLPLHAALPILGEEQQRKARGDDRPVVEGAAARLPAPGAVGLLGPDEVAAADLVPVVPAEEALAGEPADRKSTRLNSSHLVISYAVFCLKKKKL